MWDIWITPRKNFGTAVPPLLVAKFGTILFEDFLHGIQNISGTRRFHAYIEQGPYICVETSGTKNFSVLEFCSGTFQKVSFKPWGLAKIRSQIWGREQILINVRYLDNSQKNFRNSGAPTFGGQIWNYFFWRFLAPGIVTHI